MELKKEEGHLCYHMSAYHMIHYSYRFHIYQTFIILGTDDTVLIGMI